MKIFSYLEPISVLRDLKSNIYINARNVTIKAKLFLTNLISLRLEDNVFIIVLVQYLLESILIGTIMTSEVNESELDQRNQVLHILTNKITNSNFDNFILLLKVT